MLVTYKLSTVCDFHVTTGLRYIDVKTGCATLIFKQLSASIAWQPKKTLRLFSTWWMRYISLKHIHMLRRYTFWFAIKLRNKYFTHLNIFFVIATCSTKKQIKTYINLYCDTFSIIIYFVNLYSWFKNYSFVNSKYNVCFMFTPVMKRKRLIV